MVHLIASMGTAPSILTEAIWFMEKDRGLPVTGLTCVGTQASLASAQKDLFSPGGALDRLRKHLHKPKAWLGPEEVHWEAEPLKAEDSNTEAEAKALDRAFRVAILTAQRKGEDPVWACISGGRKTMAAGLQQAMVLLSREQDHAFHVLLISPNFKLEGELQASGWGFPGDTFPRLQAESTLPALQDRGELGICGVMAPLVKLRAVATAYGINLASERLVRSLQAALEPAKLYFRLEDQYLLGKVGSDLLRLNRLRPNEAILLGAMLKAKKTCTLAELVDQGQALARSLNRSMGDSYLSQEKVERFFSGQEKGQTSKIGTPLSNLRKKLLAAAKAVDPRLMSLYALRRGNSGSVDNKEIGFINQEAYQNLIMIPPKLIQRRRNPT